ncbi:GSU2403 family nucleotidyltransferase fold protein [Ancylobacter sp. 6x-1]|uniref:GSU2403 family nucleotidyltransferase fold protein n=1 Tax=Ancylobacter crimeensis TaxID=2579147 RepID=A0ABT0DF03_9HYPH|nr:GSU2403 family nucleotidyltransferase fold protein [Ancylobacter crimeensis]MCK0198530.1 GSU2403 family nucleotidyltransferase fold protein [Ancylobacter crimeensis]
MKLLDHSYRTLYSELAQRTLDAQFSSEFSIEGRFVSMESRSRRYWYFDLAKPGGGKQRRYVGPVDDPEISARVEHFADLKADHRARRKLVSTLIREAYLPRPDPLAGDIIQALATAGFFRLRGVLVGTVAFQCYAAVLGVRLPNTALQTGDTDFAQFHSISVAVEDAMPPVLDVLRAVDATFREIPHPADGRASTQFATRSGYKVEFLTPNTGSAEYDGRPAAMPALGGAAAQPLRFLDFLIYQPVRAVLLHGSGVPILVPAPERFAIHKLIVSVRRRTDNDGTAKSDKDRDQAVTLMVAMIETRQSEALAEAYMEAWDRGPAWRDAIGASLRALSEDARAQLIAPLAAAIRALGADPVSYDLPV